MKVVGDLKENLPETPETARALSTTRVGQAGKGALLATSSSAPELGQGLSRCRPDESTPQPSVGLGVWRVAETRGAEQHRTSTPSEGHWRTRMFLEIHPRSPTGPRRKAPGPESGKHPCTGPAHCPCRTPCFCCVCAQGSEPQLSYIFSGPWAPRYEEIWRGGTWMPVAAEGWAECLACGSPPTPSGLAPAALLSATSSDLLFSCSTVREKRVPLEV